jgi:hypothetical protein
VKGDKMKVIYIYQITYPNEKIYIGSDSTGDMMRYFGSPDQEYLERDFSWEKINELPNKEIKIIKKILWFKILEDNVSENDKKELLKLENEYIVKNEANNPKKGYNQKPKYQ